MGGHAPPPLAAPLAPDAARELGTRLVAALEEPAAQEILAVSGGTWTAGGCWLLAAALARWARPRGEVVALARPHPVEHVVFRLGGWYLDGHGAATRRELIARWRGDEALREATMTVFRPKEAARARADQIPFSADRVAALAAHLAAHLGPAAPWVERLEPAPAPGRGAALGRFLASGRPPPA